MRADCDDLRKRPALAPRVQFREFGATTLVSGHLPGRTETLSFAIYARIEAFEDGEAFLLSLVSLLLAFSITAAAEVFLRGKRV